MTLATNSISPPILLPLIESRHEQGNRLTKPTLRSTKRGHLPHAVHADLPLLALALAGTCLPVDATSPTMDRIIELPHVSGRIDHMAADLKGRRLFVAEVANNTLDVVDLRSGKVTGRIRGMKGPQGVAYLPQQGLVVVASRTVP
jgi:hypothetical protein